MKILDNQGQRWRPPIVYYEYDLLPGHVFRHEETLGRFLDAHLDQAARWVTVFGRDTCYRVSKLPFPEESAMDTAKMLDLITRAKAIALKFAGAVVFGVVAWVCLVLVHLGIVLGFAIAYALAGIVEKALHPATTVSAATLASHDSSAGRRKGS